MTAPLLLSALYVYPIKSMPGLSLSEAQIDRRGLRYDRRWMVVDAQGRQVTAREHPRLLQPQVDLLPSALQVRAPGMPPLFLPLALAPEPDSREVRPVTVWGEEMKAVSVGPESSAWFSDYLGGRFDLVYMPETTERWQAGESKPYRALLSFVDGNPFHLVAEASLAALNTELSTPIGVGRFRPNLVVRGPAAYAEDFWRRVTIGAVPFRVVESCDRCVMINLSGAAKPGAEPLRTLARLRQTGKKVPFGQHLILDGWQPDWRLRVGDLLTVQETAQTPNPMY